MSDRQIEFQRTSNLEVSAQTFGHRTNTLYHIDDNIEYLHAYMLTSESVIVSYQRQREGK